MADDDQTSSDSDASINSNYTGQTETDASTNSIYAGQTETDLQEAIAPEPAVVAHATFPSTQCSIWDCNRRGVPYCCFLDSIAAMEDSRLQTPIVLPIKPGIADFESAYCLKALECLKSGFNPGIPDIVANLLLQHPWMQPDKFCINFFKRESMRWYMFLNPYNFEDDENAIWKLQNSTTSLNTVRCMFKPNATSEEDADLAKLWRLYRYSVVIEGDVKKGLYLMRYKPPKNRISVTTDERQLLASSCSESPVELNSENFDDIVNGGSKDVLVLYFKPGCSLCNLVSETYKKVAGVCHKDKRVVIASLDVSEHSEIIEGTEIVKHPTLLFYSNANQEKELINVDWFSGSEDLISFINDRIGLYRHQPEPEEAAIGLSSDVQNREPASIAIAEYPESMCNLWDCTRRLPCVDDRFCRVHHKLIAEHDQREQSPLLIPDVIDIVGVEKLFSLKVLDSLRRTHTTGVPDVARNLMLQFPWQQPDMFGRRFFKREKSRWWAYINPYDFDKGEEQSCWKEDQSKKFGDYVRTRFQPKGYPTEDADSAKCWRLFRYSIVVDGNDEKGLYVMNFKPRGADILLLADERLASSSGGSPVPLTDENTDSILFNDNKACMILFSETECGLCNSVVETFKKVAALFHKDESLTLASLDASTYPHLLDLYGVKRHPALVFIPPKDEGGYEIEDSERFSDFARFIDRTVGPKNIN